MITILISLTVMLALLLVAVVALDHRVQSDLETELAGERERANRLDLQHDKECRTSARLRMELAEARAKLVAAPLCVPVGRDVTADLDLGISEDEIEKLFAGSDADECVEISDAELHALFEEREAK
jgi:hypothetical protein